MISLNSLTFDERGFTRQGDQGNARIWVCPTEDQMGLFLQKAWAFFEQELGLSEKKSYKAEINKQLEKDAIYKEIYSKRAT